MYKWVKSEWVVKGSPAGEDNGTSTTITGVESQSLIKQSTNSQEIRNNSVPLKFKHSIGKQIFMCYSNLPVYLLCAVSQNAKSTQWSCLGCCAWVEALLDNSRCKCCRYFGTPAVRYAWKENQLLRSSIQRFGALTDVRPVLRHCKCCEYWS